MRYCTKCGNQIMDEAIVCPACGCATEHFHNSYAAERKNTSGLKTAAKVLMIISTVVMGLYIIPLAWCLPMTIIYCNKIKRGEHISTGFKVCSLIFVNTIAGILMLCDTED